MKDQHIVVSKISFLLLILCCLYIIGGFAHPSKLTESLKKTIKDTIPTTPKPKSKLQQEKDDGVPSISEILDDQLKRYKDTIKVDTTFLLNGHNTMTVKLRHFCTFDNKINLPYRYLKIYNLPKFQTHNFISALEVKINSKVVFNGFIKKEDFKNLLDAELKKYGVLLNPNLELSNNNLSIQYSISVPLSDVGKGFTIKIDTLGNKHVTTD